MPQRDIQSKLRAEFLETITFTGTGDVDGTVSVDTKGVRAVMFILDIQADVPVDADALLQAIESDDDSTFTEVAAEKMLPYENPEIEVLAVAETPRQTYGVFGTKRYVRPRFNITAVTGSIDINVLAVSMPESQPDGGVATDALP